jgi:hypothetical protein
LVKSEYGDKSGKAAKIAMTASCVAEPPRTRPKAACVVV